MGVEQEIKDKALELGLDAVGITDVSRLGSEHVERFEAWLQSGCAGRMEYMHRNVEKRIDPAQLRKGAQSVIIVALNCKPPASIADCSPGSKSGVTTLRIADSASQDNSPIDTATAEMAGTVQGSQTCGTPAPGGDPSDFPAEGGWATGVPHPTGSEIHNPKHVIASEARQSAIRNLPAEPVGRVALYAQYEDYHLFIKALLRELAGFLGMRTGRQDRFKVCVDSAPVAEKALAVRAGLGFIGKNHLLIHPRLGPQILLGELLTSVPLEPDKPMEATCLGCNRCMEACPTGALRPDGLLDAARCTSYLTQYGPEDAPLGSTGHWLFGCDECLRACPFHQKAPAGANRRFRFYPERARPNLQELLELTPEAFETRFRDSPIRRLGLERLKRNAKRCLSF